MEKYEVVSVIGEGSFGRVYKARVHNSDAYVALKLIVKKGRTAKEIAGLNQECEILRKLNHPNIIPMLDSFETENEIVVITEFVDRELFEILGQEGYLPEEQVQKITLDLVSALFYLHSNRVLHRDLKPQNVLLDRNGRAKLCDFGFARCMGNSTHVLTSIKGTPLYMAPELIDGTPYDHTADLWSLGCIVYQLLLGSPPFNTTSILQLVQLIQHETIQWPDFISPACKDFLQGLLQKSPENRLSWQQILQHPFLKNGVLQVQSEVNNPFTSEMSASQCLAKESQTKAILSKNDWKRRPEVRRGSGTFQMPQAKTSSCPETIAEPASEKKMLHSSWMGLTKSTEISTKVLASVEKDISSLSIEETKEEVEESACSGDRSQSLPPPNTFKKSGQVFTLHSWDSAASARPIENEEWMAFLQRNMEEIMTGQLECLRNHNLVSVVVAPLRNCNASCRVLEYVASMLSLPFVIDGPSEKDLEQIKQVYLEIKVIPNLVYASKIVARRRGYDSEASSPTVVPGSEILLRPVSELSADELQALENIYLLLCHLVHCGEDFLIQFCDAAAILNAVALMQQFLLLGRRKVRIVTDLLAILNLILRDLPENSDVVEQIILGTAGNGQLGVDLSRLLTHPSGVVRSRSCQLVGHLWNVRGSGLQTAWNPRLEQDIHALLSDSVPSVRTAAEEVYKGVRGMVEGKTG